MNTIKCLFLNANDLIFKLMVSITRGVSLWYRPQYRIIIPWQRQQTPKNFSDRRADTGFRIKHSGLVREVKNLSLNFKKIV